MTSTTFAQPQIYQGQFGEYTITKSDRIGVVIYRFGLVLAAIGLIITSNLLFIQGQEAVTVITPLFVIFSIGLGISLVTIHIYLAVLHRVLQLCWLIGSIASIIIAWQTDEPLALYVYHHPISLFGIGFTFVALTGIYFKEAFCFNRLETKFLTVIVPFLLLGHLLGWLPVAIEQILLAMWTILFTIFAVRKMIQPIDPDIGDKSVFAYLKDKKSVTN
jgi:uncharacterized integral membrane protein